MAASTSAAIVGLAATFIMFAIALGTGLPLAFAAALATKAPASSIGLAAETRTRGRRRAVEVGSCVKAICRFSRLLLFVRGLGFLWGLERRVVKHLILSRHLETAHGFLQGGAGLVGYKHYFHVLPFYGHDDFGLLPRRGVRDDLYFQGVVHLGLAQQA